MRKRNKHNLSYYKLVTCDMGQLVPVACVEVLPGDTFRHSTSVLLRVSPLISPVMHPVQVRLHHWFVSYRLLWTGFEQFITGGSDGAGGSSGSFPTITAGGGGFAAKGLMDYLGVPPSVASLEVSALFARAYNLIWNKFYRDQDLQTLLTVPTAAGADSTSPVTVQKICYEKDYLTSLRTTQQKGTQVSLALGTSAPLQLTTRVDNVNNLRLTPLDGSIDRDLAFTDTQLSPSIADPGQSDPRLFFDRVPNLEANMSAVSGINITALRTAFAQQSLMEARSMYGSEYVDYLSFLGVRSADSRLQRPEYLGGGKQTISFSEVLQTGGTDAGAQTGVGNLAGHGISALRSNSYMRTFSEHGVVLTLMSVRPKSLYVGGLARKFLRRTKEDFWQLEHERIGQQIVTKREVYAANTGPTDTFGYGDRYDEYRHEESTAVAEFRTSTMNDWHLGRIFGSNQTLNAAFVECDPTKRVLADQTNNSLWCMVSNNIQARRIIGRPKVGRVF